MRGSRLVSSALKPLRSHRLRSALSLAGVAIGVAAVILCQAVSMGAKEQMRQDIQRVGTDLLVVKPVELKRLVSRQQIRGLATSLSEDDVEAIRSLPSVSLAVPSVEGNARVKIGNTAMRTMIRGAPVAFAAIRRFEIQNGRGFTPMEEDDAHRVAVLGARVSEELGQGAPLVGKEIRIRGVPYEIIGELAARGTSTDGADQDNQVWIPLRTAARRVFNVHWLSAIYLVARDAEQIATAEADVRALLRARHARHRLIATDDFAVQSTTKTRSFQQAIVASLSDYATALAAIALLIGSFGILALMLLSVRERSTEIGLRVAVGATARDILLQFLIESTILTSTGWLAGLLCGILGSLAIALGASWSVAVPWRAVGASLLTTLLVGLGFGTLPARTAARISPIDALLDR